MFTLTFFSSGKWLRSVLGTLALIAACLMPSLGHAACSFTVNSVSLSTPSGGSATVTISFNFKGCQGDLLSLAATAPNTYTYSSCAGATQWRCNAVSTVGSTTTSSYSSNTNGNKFGTVALTYSTALTTCFPGLFSVTPLVNGTSGTAVTSICSGKISQIITFGTPPTVRVGSTGTLTATGGASGNPVTFTVSVNSLPGICSITSAGVITGLAPGVCTIAANQAGNASYDPAATSEIDITIVGQSQTITFAAQTSPRTFAGGSTFSISPIATASSGLTVTYSSLATSVCTVSGTTVTMVAAGTCTIAADQAGNGTYAAAAQVTQSVTLTAVSVSAFSAFETSISNAAAGTASARLIKTRVAGTSGTLCQADGSTCALKIAGFNAGVVDTSYSGTVSASLEFCANVSRVGAGATSTVSCGGTWSAIASVSTVSVAVSAGVGTVTFGFSNNAYEIARVKIVSSASPAGTWYSDDYFSIRPAFFAVDGRDFDASTAYVSGTARCLNGGTILCASSSGVTHKAMAPFTLSAQAFAGVGTPASNYPGTGAGPVPFSVTTSSPTGAGVVNGALTVGNWSASGGTLTSTTATYSEVGTFAAVVQDQSFANVDMADTSTADRYFSGTVSLGRFTPDHLQTVVTKACNAFTYSGQPFTVQITALSLSGSPTRNYGLTSGTVALSDALASVSGSLTNSTVASTAFSTATGIALTNTPTFTFAARSTTPTSISIRATDGDSIRSTGYETLAGNTVVSGRLSLMNAYGSEQLSLPVLTRLEYYDSGSWRPSAATAYADSCTSLAAGNFAFTTASACTSAVTSCNTAALVTATLSAGLYKSPWTVGLLKPMAAGTVCVAVNLDAAAIGNQCTATGATATPSTAAQTNGVAGAAWLKYPWSGGSATNPVARATFGIYKSPLIYRRENY